MHKVTCKIRITARAENSIPEFTIMQVCILFPVHFKSVNPNILPKIRISASIENCM